MNTANGKVPTRPNLAAGTFIHPRWSVEGHLEFVGSDERQAAQAIENATKVRKTPVSISSSLSDEKTITLHIEAGPLPSAVTAESASVFLAIADNTDQSQVNRGVPRIDRI